MLKPGDRFLSGERGKKGAFLVFFSLGCLVQPLSSIGQELNREGWAVPDLKGLAPYSLSIRNTDGVEKIMERFYTPKGGHVARIIGNGKVFAYAIDRDQDPPIDYLILDPDGSGKFTLKFGPNDSYLLPEWISR